MTVKNGFKKAMALVLSVFVIVTFSGCDGNINSADTKIKNLTVEYIDVGQGDSTLIQLPDGRNMLIDGGTQATSNQITEHIKNLGIESIDIVVATHPHEDHIGGLDDIINSFEIGEVFMPQISEKDMPDTRIYEQFLEAVKAKGCSVSRAAAGTLISSEDHLKIDCLSPAESDYGNLNNYSAVIRVIYYDITFLFMGDAETEIENRLMKDYPELEADIVKAGHHGSTTSNSAKFIKKLSPSVAVISCGIDNRYRHPRPEILSRYRKVGADIYRTDTQGDITVKCNGRSYTVSTEKQT